MALEAETKRIAALFDHSDEDVNKGVEEFLKQIGMSIEDLLLLSCAC
jgi:hexokinase